MGCGGCGGASRSMQKAAAQRAARPTPTTRPAPAPRLRPTTTTKMVVTSSPNVIIKVKQNLQDLKACPLCGSQLSPILSGSGARNRKRCTRCNRTFI